VKAAAAASRLSSAAEASIVALAIAGDIDGFEELVRRRQGMVRGLMRQLSGDPILADDLAQQAFVQAWRNIGRLRAPGAFGGWLRQVAVNVWLQDARRARRPDDALDEAAEVAREAGPAIEVGERIDLSRALARLKPSERLCVVLSHAEGMSHAEIAAATGWPLGTVKSQIARGVVRLRAELQEQTDDGR
jgi:RNA polymerase sigma-70 factor, ECF subfamily